MTNQRTTFIVRHGWVIDSITINGIMVGTSRGGNMSSFELEPTETILYVSADRVKFEGRVCLTKLKFTTSRARVLGPFGNPPGNLRLIDSIAFNVTIGGKVGESSGGSFNQINLMPGEQIVHTRADRVRYQGMICLGRLYLKTSSGREFGPFGTAPAGNC